VFGAKNQRKVSKLFSLITQQSATMTTLQKTHYNNCWENKTIYLISVLQSNATILLTKINAVSSSSTLHPWMKKWRKCFAQGYWRPKHRLPAFWQNFPIFQKNVISHKELPLFTTVLPQ
jgi:hypothetical protein